MMARSFFEFQRISTKLKKQRGFRATFHWHAMTSSSQALFILNLRLLLSIMRRLPLLGHARARAMVWRERELHGSRSLPLGAGHDVQGGAFDVTPFHPPTLLPSSLPPSLPSSFAPSFFPLPRSLARFLASSLPRSLAPIRVGSPKQRHQLGRLRRAR